MSEWSVQFDPRLESMHTLHTNIKNILFFFLSFGENIISKSCSEVMVFQGCWKFPFILSYKSIVSKSYSHGRCQVWKIMEVTPGTLDVKSRPMKYQKGLWLQLMCCTPFRLLSQDFGMRKMEYWRSENQSKSWSCFQSRT